MYDWSAFKTLYFFGWRKPKRCEQAAGVRATKVGGGRVAGSNRVTLDYRGARRRLWSPPPPRPPVPRRRMGEGANGRGTVGRVAGGGGAYDWEHRSH